MLRPWFATLAAGLLASCITLPPPLPLADGADVLAGGDAAVAAGTVGTSTPDSLTSDSGSESDAVIWPPWTHPCGEGYGEPAARRVDAGGSLACLVDGGEATCWGYELGLPHADSATQGDLVDLGVSDISTLTLGMAHGCARKTSGEIFCFGRGGHGQLGFAVPQAGAVPAYDDAHPTPKEYTALEHDIIADVFADNLATTTCVIGWDGAVACWGFVMAGEIWSQDVSTGTPTALLVSAPELVHPARAGIAVGLAAACLWEDAGRAWCWGYGTHGALGNGAAASTAFPQPVALGGDQAVDGISFGGGHACAWTNCGSEVFCWGENPSGQLGLPANQVGESTPQSVAGLPNPVVEVGAGLNHSCALGASGDVYCWGANDLGQLAQPSSVGGTEVPQLVAGLSDVTGLAVGANFACALESSGSVKCWGDNEFGQLGARPADLALSRIPHLVEGL